MSLCDVRVTEALASCDQNPGLMVLELASGANERQHGVQAWLELGRMGFALLQIEVFFPPLPPCKGHFSVSLQRAQSVKHPELSPGSESARLS